MKATNDQKKCIATLVAKMGLQLHKKDMVLSFTHAREESSKEMLVDEANEMIAYLKSIDPDEVSAEKMRRKIISMAHEIGYRIPGTKTVNMQKLDNWCMGYGYLHKKLNQYTQKELPRLVTQFENMYKSHLERL